MRKVGLSWFLWPPPLAYLSALRCLTAIFRIVSLSGRLKEGVTVTMVTVTWLQLPWLQLHGYSYHGYSYHGYSYMVTVVTCSLH